jgi:hypothetical protein
MTPYDNLTDSELDRLVAERVLGWKVCQKTDSYIRWEEPNGRLRLQLIGWANPPSTRFSSDHNAFFTHVVPAMRDRGFWLEIQDHDMEVFSVNWCDTAHSQRYECKTIPRAGCIAALLALDALERVKKCLL